MSIEQKFGQIAQKNWDEFVSSEQLTQNQADKFQRFLILLDDWNKKTNLTRITNVPDILSLHFQDSMRITQFVDFSTIASVCDVGSGGGFPGIPLAILLPQTKFTLLEVNNKKVAFLQAVIDELELANCTVNTLDWRTFLRQAPVEIDLFCARASLKPDELIRIFSPSCVYKDAQLVYWASKNWKPEGSQSEFLRTLESYTVDGQHRIFAIFEGL